MRRTGFTLIELLVVIAIVAILAAILFPVFSSAKKRAWEGSCLSNLKQLSHAVRRYADDNNSLVPPMALYYFSSINNWCGSEQTFGKAFPYKGSLFPYVMNRNVYFCPSDRNRKPTGLTALPVSEQKNENFWLSYSMNGTLNKRVGGGSQCLSMDSVRRQSKVMLLIHEDRKTINDGLYLWLGNALDRPDPIHYDGTTCSYVDGHVKWVSCKEIERIQDQQHTSEWVP